MVGWPHHVQANFLRNVEQLGFCCSLLCLFKLLALASTDDGLGHVILDSGLLPLDGRLDELQIASVLVVHGKGEERVDQVLAQQMRLQSKLLKLVAAHVVVVLLLLGTRVRDVHLLHVQSELVALGDDNVSNFVDGPGLGDLVEDAHLSLLSRVVDGDLEAPDGVPDVEHSPGLSSLSIHGQRVAEGGLDAEPVGKGSVDTVVVETVDEHRVGHGLLRADTVHDTLIEIRGRNVPGASGEQDVGAIVTLGQVVEGPSLFRVREHILTSVVLNLNVSLLNVDIRSSVLSHGSKLDKVAIGGQLLDSVENIDCTNNVVLLGVHGPGPVNHGVGRRALLSKVNDGLRLEGGERLLEEGPVTHITDHELDMLSGHLGPLLHTVVWGSNRGQGVGSQLQVDGPPDQVVDDRDLISTGRQVKSGGPTTVSVSSDDHDARSGTRGVGSSGHRGLGGDSLDLEGGARRLPRRHGGLLQLCGKQERVERETTRARGECEREGVVSVGAREEFKQGTDPDRQGTLAAFAIRPLFSI